MFRKILIANRGEIAVRIVRACRDLGVSPVAIYSEVDRGALHVRLADEAYPCGPPRASDSYLKGDRILDIAVACGADAIHPGYGFLSENGDFAEHCGARGLHFIGPSPSVIRTMGDKVAARRCVEAIGIATVPGTIERLSDGEIADKANEIGYPVMLKASAGGGGKGLRRVVDASQLAKSLERARGEALASFSDDGVYLEKYLESARHIEIQILADTHGRVLQLFERDCSLQRRHQKLFEEAPALGQSAARRAEMGDAAVAIAKAVNYVGVGTCEFLQDAAGFYFLEMNTRLQVEHAVTEAITGLDLVEQMIRVAAGEALSFSQQDVPMRGHAMEARIYAEDPDKNFAPSPGRIDVYRPADGIGVRVDGGVQAGDTVSAYYDPLIAKLVVWGPDREQCLARLRRSLDEFAIRGIKTSLPFHRALVRNPSVIRCDYDTGFVDRELRAILAAAEQVADATTLCVVLAAIEMSREAADSASSTWRVSERKGGSWVVSIALPSGTRFRASIAPAEPQNEEGANALDGHQAEGHELGDHGTTEWDLDVLHSGDGMISLIRAGYQCEAAIQSATRKGERHVEVAVPGRRMQLVVESVKGVESAKGVEGS